MILSVSRRTDIPAFYCDWFFNRLKAGYVLVRNPMNPNQVSRVPLNPDTVECIVFWTKNPSKILLRLDELDDYHYYFQITITPYGPDIEPGVPSVEIVIDSFQKLSHIIGKEKTIWRYDPILLSDRYTTAYHINRFEAMAKALSGYTEKCVISFVDVYAKNKKNMASIAMKEISESEMRHFAETLSKIATKYMIKLETCSEAIDLNSINISSGKCIDDQLISRIIGLPVSPIVPKDNNQRETCGCVKSVDIGIYNTCPHHCLYCYANTSISSSEKNFQNHDTNSELLFGQLDGSETIYERKLEKYFESVQLQLQLF